MNHSTKLVQTIELIKRKIMSHGSFPKNAIVDGYADYRSDDLVMSITRHLYGKNLSEFSASWPKDWFEAFKERWFPKWLLKRYPVKYNFHEVKIDLVFPEWAEKLQDRMGPISIMVTDGRGKVGLYDEISEEKDYRFR